MSDFETEKERKRDREEYIATLKWRISHGFLKVEDFDQALKDWTEGKIE
jgi:uncharacterized protein YnzC (UPF0291/DUF896 family)